MKDREAKMPPEAKLHLTQALDYLVKLYEAMDRLTDAARWRAEATK